MQQAYQLLTTSPVLGCYNCCEITTAFLIDKKCKVPRNYYTICVLEERCTFSEESRNLTPRVYLKTQNCTKRQEKDIKGFYHRQYKEVIA